MGSYGNEFYGGEWYLDGDGDKVKSIKSMMGHFYQSHYTGNAAMWQQGAIDTRFKAGDQTLNSMMYGENNNPQSRRFFFNLIRRQINMICGRQRQQRKSTVTLPLQKADALADDYNAVIKWSETRDGFQEYLSQAFEGACTTGLSLLNLYMDYTYDPINGDLCSDQVSYNNFLIDTHWRKMDFSDCSFIWRRRWVSKSMAKSLLPGMEDRIQKMRPSGVKDGKFPLQAELLNINVNNLMAYDEFHYRDSREATIILDPKTGEATEWKDDESEESDMMKRVLAMQPWLIVKKKRVPTVKLAIVLADTPMYDGPNLLRIDEYPMVPIVTYHEPDIQAYAWRMQGVVRGLRDAQYLYNMRQVINLDLLQSQVQNAWVYPVDVVVDPKAFRQTQNGCVIPIKAGHSVTEIQRLDPQGIPPSIIELTKMLADTMPQISGVNEELLGAAQDDQSGILSMLRQGAGLTTLQTIFDKLDYSQRLYGQLRLKAILKNFSKGKIAAILGKEPNEKFFTASSVKYNVTVEEGNYSSSQRQMELQQLLHFKQIGIPISDKSILQAAFITNKAQVIQDMEEQQAQQAEQMKGQQEVESEKTRADVMLKYAQSKAELAKEADMKASSQEKMARVQEIEASAESKKMGAELDLVRQLIALEDMDVENFKRSLELSEVIKYTTENLVNPIGGYNGQETEI